MTTIEEQIESIKKEIRETPYHKGTEHHIGLLRARIARLKDKQIEHVHKSKGGGGGGYAIKKQGDATIVLVGPPSAGKSTLLNQLTNAKSKIAPYAFTTLTVIPGMMTYRDAEIQILDVPGLIEGAEEGKGRGREVMSVVRSSDLLLIMTDIKRPQAVISIIKALERNGIRINKSRPNVFIEKKVSGGITIHTNLKQELSKLDMEEIAYEFGIKNADITIKQKLTLNEYIDALSTNRVYLPAIIVMNKSDLGEIKTPYDVIKISADKGEGLDLLKENIWNYLGLIRIYLVKKDDEPNTDNPMIVPINSSLQEIALSIGEEFAEDKTKAIIWGPGSKFPAQEVSLKSHAVDGMQIRYI